MMFRATLNLRARPFAPLFQSPVRQIAAGASFGIAIELIAVPPFHLHHGAGHARFMHGPGMVGRKRAPQGLRRLDRQRRLPLRG